MNVLHQTCYVYMYVHVVFHQTYIFRVGGFESHLSDLAPDVILHLSLCAFMKKTKLFTNGDSHYHCPYDDCEEESNTLSRQEHLQLL
jgi:hypothetical protein